MSLRPAGSGRGAAGVGAKCSAALEQRSAGRLVSGVTSNHTSTATTPAVGAAPADAVLSDRRGLANLPLYAARDPRAVVRLATDRDMLRHQVDRLLRQVDDLLHLPASFVAARDAVAAQLLRDGDRAAAPSIRLALSATATEPSAVQFGSPGHSTSGGRPPSFLKPSRQGVRTPTAGARCFEPLNKERMSVRAAACTGDVDAAPSRRHMLDVYDRVRAAGARRFGAFGRS